MRGVRAERASVDARAPVRFASLALALAVTSWASVLGFTSSTLAREPGDARCMGRRATIVSDEETVRGTARDDVIVATAWGQRIRAGAGDDLVCGEGRDRIWGGRGNDSILEVERRGQLLGGPGDDRLSAAVAILKGQGGDDTLVCGGGHAYGGRGDDRVESTAYCSSFAGPGDDVEAAPPTGESGERRGSVVDYQHAPRGVVVDLRRNVATGWGRDRLLGVHHAHGSEFADRLVGDPRDNSLVGYGGDDVMLAGGGDERLDGDFGGDDIRGGPGNDTIMGSDILSEQETAPHRLRGGAGDDFVVGADGDDSMRGGAGADMVWFPTGRMNVDLSEREARGSGHDRLLGFENVSTDYASDQLVGDDGPNVFIGGAYRGGDVIEGRGGDDQVWMLYGGKNTLDGGAGTDWITWGVTDGPMEVDLAAGTAEGAFTSNEIVAFEDVTGSASNDKLFGDAGENHIYGSRGDDEVYGREAGDVLDGGDGVDVADGGEGADQCVESEVVLGCETTSRRRLSSPTRSWLTTFAEVKASYEAGVPARELRGKGLRGKELRRVTLRRRGR